MANDTSLALRQQVIVTLRADPDLTALVPSARIFGLRSPSTLTWPFTRYGAPDALPFRGQCMDGATISFTIHSFSKQEFEDECAGINAAVSSALDQRAMDLPGARGVKARIVWKGSQIIPDAAEANVWHGVNRFEATVV
jgi:hypothetical protein